MLSTKIRPTRLDAVPTEAQMKLILSQTLSSPSFYNAPVIVLDFEVEDDGTSRGRFRDAVKPRVFSFEIAKSGISYQPFTPGRLDSLIVEEWEEFSDGYSYRIDSGASRTGKPNCNEAISFPCGRACVSLKKNCKTNPKDSVSAARKETAIAATKVYSKATKKTKVIKETPPPVEKESKAKAKKAKSQPPEPQQEISPPVVEKTKRSGSKTKLKIEPESEKQSTKGLVGDGTHEGVPRNAKEYREMMSKSGKDISLEDAESIIDSIKDWSSGSYSSIRKIQQQGRKNGDADNISDFIKNSTPYKGEIYRGISFESEAKAREWLKGDKNGVLDNQSAHASWSSDLETAEEFAYVSTGSSKQSVVIKSINKTGASIKNLSKLPDESEVIVPKDAKHRVKNITKKDGIIYVEVEEV